MLSVSSLSRGATSAVVLFMALAPLPAQSASLSASNVCDWKGMFREPYGQRR